MSTEPIDIKVRDQISGNIASKLQDIGTAASNSYNAVEELKASLASFSALGDIAKASQEAEDLRAELRGATSALSELTGAANQASGGLDAASGSAHELSSNLDNVDTRTKNLGNSGRELAQIFSRVALTIGAVFGARVLAQAADQGTTLKDQLEFVTDATMTTSEAFENLADIARQTGLRFEDVGQQFTANARIMSEMGKTTQEQMTFQEGLSGALATSGLRGEAAAVVMNALSRSMARGTLRGEEFNTVMERGQDVVRLIAEEMGVTTGELRALAEAGEITSERLYNAFTGPIDEINERVSGMSWSIAGAMNAFNTELVRFVSNTNDATGAARIFAEIILWAADNVGILVTAAGLFMAAWGVTGLIGVVLNATTAISALIPVLVSLGAVIVAHPVMFLTVALTAAALAVAYMTGNLDGLIAALKKGVADVMGLNTESEELAETIADNDNVAAQLGDNIVRIGGEGAPAIGEADQATDAFGATLDSSADSAATLAENLWDAVDAAKALSAAQGSSGDGASEGGSELPGFARGADFMVGGRTGVDQNVVSFRASRGERVKVQTQAQQRDEMNARGSVTNNINLTVVTPDADSFRRSSKQIAQDLRAQMAG